MRRDPALPGRNPGMRIVDPGTFVLVKLFGIVCKQRLLTENFPADETRNIFKPGCKCMRKNDHRLKIVIGPRIYRATTG
jgi:hypothetical protein